MENILSGKRFNRIALVSGLVLYWVLCLYLAQKSEVPVEPGDGITHYHMAHYAFKYPEKFLSHWGKPLFTILSAPFAQLGFIGMIIFNLVIFSLSAALLYRTARIFRLALPGLAPFILMSSMVYFKMVTAGMTEILMAGLGAASLYLLAVKRYTFAAIIASLSIVARPESIVLIPLMALFLAREKQWKAIPWLGLGFVFFTIIGFAFAGKPIGWVISEDPYPAISPYGHGNPDRFFGTADLSLGYWIIVGMLIGLTYLMVKSFRRGINYELKLGWFATLMVLLVMMLHTYLWWKGLKGSLGLIRVIASVIPLAAFSAMLGINAVLKNVKFRSAIAPVFMALLLFSNVHAYVKSELPRKISPREKMMLQAGDWYTENFQGGRVSLYDPYLSFVLELDPYDTSRVVFLGTLNRKDPSLSLNKGDLIIWDSLFSPREGGLPESAVIDNPNLEVLKTMQTQTVPVYTLHIARVK